MRIRPKKEEPEKKTPDMAKKDWNDRIDALQFVTQVHTRNKLITEDYPLANLNEKDKTGIIETQENCKYAMYLMEKIKRADVWEYGKKRKLRPDEIQKIERMQEDIRNAYLTRCDTVAVLARNDEKNYMLKVLGRIEEDEKTSPEEDTKSILQAIKDKFKPDGTQ